MQTTTQTWRGCVGSRSAPLDEQASFGSTRIKGFMNKTCGAEIRELTKSMGKANSTIQSMTASRNTYLPAGVMWGWRPLQDEAPQTKKTLALCNAAKADDVQIFTIGYRMDASSASTKSLLTACATSPDQYKDAKNAAEVKKVFKELAGKLNFSRLAM